MSSLAFAIPILPGKMDECRAWAGDVMGSRSGETTQSKSAIGLDRESCWIQSTPQGDMLVVLLEGDDVAAANRSFASSESPYDVWFKERVQSFSGIDFSVPIPALPEQVVDWRR